MKKIRVALDMDGSVANLYGIDNWLERLRSEDETIFTECEPMVTEEKLLDIFPKESYDIRILSMTPKGASKEYCDNVAKQKNAWLDKYFPSITKRTYIPYGNNKNFKNSKRAILVDDNETIRKNFKGISVNPIDLW